MRRFWYPDQLAVQQTVELSGELFHHICEVCRFQVGDRFELLSPSQEAHLVELVSVGKKSAQARSLEARNLPQLARPWIHLCLSIPKFATLEGVLEKAVELGVHQVTPFFSDYSFVRTEQKITAEKLKRWQKIIVSACQQSGRGPLLYLNAPKPLKTLFDSFNPGAGIRGLFAYEGQAGLSLSQRLKQLQIEKPQEIWVFVGSEGGFSRFEVESFKQRGLEPVSMGEQILRVETACVALVSVIKYEMGLM